MIFAKMRQGSAISRARGERNPRISPGRIRLLIIQNPNTPIPRSTATDSNVAIKRLNWYLQCFLFFFLPFLESSFERSAGHDIVQSLITPLMRLKNVSPLIQASSSFSVWP